MRPPEIPREARPLCNHYTRDRKYLRAGNRTAGLEGEEQLAGIDDGPKGFPRINRARPRKQI